MTLFLRFFQHNTSSFHKRGWIFFQVAIFLLPSSAFLSSLFLLVAVVLGSRNRNTPYLSDPWNYPFVLVTLLMIIGCINAYSGWLAWIGLANWLPSFWIFWAVQPYLLTSDARRRIALLFVSGTAPVVVTGLGQLWFNWSGPWQLFNGLMIWFVSSGGAPAGRLSGLFDYANIAAAWLSFVWPFSLATLLQSKLNFWQRFIVLSFAISIVAALILTDSRNAWGSLILAIPIVLGPANWYWLLPLLIVSLLPIAFAVLPGVSLQLQEWARAVVPDGVWSRLNDMRYNQQRLVGSTRLSQWFIAFQFIAERPWFGWGAAAFSVLYPLRTGLWHGHAHNLPLEVAVAHGLPVAALVVITIIALLIKSLKQGILDGSTKSFGHSRNSIFERAWWASCLILVVLHGSDMPFFDSRLNIAGWILFAGLRCVIFSNSLINPILSKTEVDAELISLV